MNPRAWAESYGLNDPRAPRNFQKPVPQSSVLEYTKTYLFRNLRKSSKTVKKGSKNALF